ncbi:MAG: nucleotidyltransferase family protein [Bacteroidales bacterium]|nr:nucleotidyltransferase family protein [Bacteroidales bacterium]
MIKNSHQINIRPDASVLFALKQMDQFERKLLLVSENNKFIGLLSIGDIQRAIINNIDLNVPVGSILRSDEYVVSRPGDSTKEIKAMMLQHRTEFMPVVDTAGELKDVLFWEDMFAVKKQEVAAQFNLPVVIMAGGKGTRLKPLTNVLPKPLIPISDKTMLEEIFDRFNQHGSSRFFISVNYKSDLIRYYVKSLNLDDEISFFEEKKPLGTAGSLSLLKGQLQETFFVSNCDILIEQDYSEILSFHRENENEITIVAALRHFPIAYGTIETEENGLLTKLLEKPELTFKINSGMYILEPHLIEDIPVDEFYNITDLIIKLQQQGRKVGVFPISQNSWIDIGDWSQYSRYLENFKT